MSEVKVLSATDKSSKALLAAVTSVKAAVTIAEETLPALLVEIENKQSDLNAIEASTKEKARLAKVELTLKVQEDEDKVLVGLMGKRGLATITTTDLAQLEARLDRDDEATKIEQAKAVSAAVSNAKADFNMTSLRTESAFNVERAELVADRNAALTKIEILEAQVASLQETVAAERQARVDIANAEAQRQGIVVNNGK